MTILEAIKERHSVRKYQDKPITMDDRAELNDYCAQYNAESGLHMQIRYDDPEGFDSKLAHYGSFENVKNYIILAGPDCPDFEEKCGYYGERMVIRAQMMGLNTCWAALTFNKKMVKKLIPEGERFCMVIALGYGQTQGVAHKGKSVKDVLTAEGELPRWLKIGVSSALMAPTAMNQQKFNIAWKDDEVTIKETGFGPYRKVDLGIVKYHFKVASGHEVK